MELHETYTKHYVRLCGASAVLEESHVWIRLRSLEPTYRRMRLDLREHRLIQVTDYLVKLVPATRPQPSLSLPSCIESAHHLVLTLEEQARAPVSTFHKGTMWTVI